MKKTMYFAALAMLGTTMVSCSSEDIYEPVEESVSTRDFKNIDFSKAWEGLELNIDFSYLFDYANTEELKVNSDVSFAEMIAESRDLIEARQDITDLVSTIEIKAGEAHLKELILLENNVKKEIIVYKDGDDIEEKSSGVYATPNNFTLLTTDLENNSTVISDYLTNNLKADSDSFIFELRVNAGKASVYVYKA